MAASVLAETQALGEEDTIALCEHLIETFVVSVAQNDPTGCSEDAGRRCLRQAVAGRRRRPSLAGGDFRAAHRTTQPGWPRCVDGLDVTEEWVARCCNQARITISAAMRQQHRQYRGRSTLDGRPHRPVDSAACINTLDETQIYDTLAQHLPELGIDTAWMALFDAEGDDPMAWSPLRAVTAPQQGESLPSREFPPEGWIPHGPAVQPGLAAFGR